MIREVLRLHGEVCPVPLWRTQEAFAALPAPGELEVHTDFARSVRNITTWCNRLGIPYSLDELRDGSWVIAIRKT